MHLIHNTPESLCQNTALFIWLGLPSSLIPFQNESNLQTPASRFSLIREHFENRFSITMTSLNHVINPTSQGCTQAFLPLVMVALSNFPGVNVVWTENIACVFAVPVFFKISSRCSVGTKPRFSTRRWFKDCASFRFMNTDNLLAIFGIVTFTGGRT